MTESRTAMTDDDRSMHDPVTAHAHPRSGDACAPDGRPAGAPAARRRQGWLVGVGILVVVIALLAVAAVIVDNTLRDSAEKAAARQIEQRLPDGVTGKVTVRIGGGSVILQYLSGTFDHVEVHAPSLRVDGVAVPAHATARGVPTDLSKPVDEVTAHVVLDAKALDAFVKIPAAESGITLGSGTLSFDGSRSLLGFTVSYRATVEPKAAGDSVTLTPKSATVTAGPAGFDFTPVVNAIIGEGPIPICVAKYLPAGVQVTHIDVTPEHATLTLHAAHVELSSAALSTTGTCN